MGMPCAHLLQRPALGDVDIGGQRAGSEGSQVDVHDAVLRGAENAGATLRGASSSMRCRWP